MPKRAFVARPVVGWTVFGFAVLGTALTLWLARGSPPGAVAQAPDIVPPTPPRKVQAIQSPLRPKVLPVAAAEKAPPAKKPGLLFLRPPLVKQSTPPPDGLRPPPGPSPDESALRAELAYMPEWSLPFDTALRTELVKLTRDREADLAFDALAPQTDPTDSEDLPPPATGPFLPPGRLGILTGLPLLKGDACRLGAKRATQLSKSCSWLRGQIVATAAPSPAGPVIDPENLRATFLQYEQGSDVLRAMGYEATQMPEAIMYRTLREQGFPGWVQMLQVENAAVRKLLVECLARSPARQCTRDLARFAATDLSPEVRQTARTGLRTRPAAEYRPVLVGYLNYPWAPVAENAAEALIELRPERTVPDLLALLREPDVTWPKTVEIDGQPRTVLPELVRINHLRNCALCHPTAIDTPAVVRGPVPDPARTLAGTSPGAAYYDTPQDPLFVRAEETYLRQDFSLVQKVGSRGNWPEDQRFDFVVRQAVLTPEQADAARTEYARGFGLSQQRRALLRVLWELTGEDFTGSSKAWQPVLTVAAR